VSSNSAIPEPTHIGKFEIEKVLGAGAMGKVYKARDPELDRFVAIKTIRLESLAASQASLDDLVARFKREAKVAAQLKHPNIVTIHEINSVPGNAYLVMEYIDGVGLDRVIKNSGKMAVERAAAIGMQVADALDYAWRGPKLVHRDIKPANIMVEPGDHVKVTDFGIAKLMTGDTVDNLTATGSLLGTPSYMSPEQTRGKELDGRSDLFSLGCILYEMVAGQRAFRGDSITALIFKIVTEEPPSLRELDPTVSDAMLHIIGKALSKAPETRYQSGRELADDLHAITQPGFVPTLRSREQATVLLAPDAPPADVPTLSSPATAQSPATLGSQPTRVSTRPPTIPPPIPPGVAPTVLTPPTAHAGAPPPIPKPPVQPARGAASAPARRQGGGAGLIIGLVAFGLLLAALAVGAGLWMMRKSTVAPPAVAEAPTTTLAAAPPTTAAAQAPSTSPAEAPPSVPPAATTPPQHAATEPRTTPRVATNTNSPATPAQTKPAATLPSGPGHAEPPAGDFSHLDDIPGDDGADGRAAGDDVAKKFRNEGQSSYTNGKYRARPNVPHGVTLQERPAVATLLYLNSVEQAYHGRSGKWGSLHDLHAAGLLMLDVGLEQSGFKRAHYGFRLTVEPDGFRAEAVPQAPIGRPFVVDDTGKVRFLD
jgi:eukaryotic-like serine/threonine-protein kinase